MMSKIDISYIVTCKFVVFFFINFFFIRTSSLLTKISNECHSLTFSYLGIRNGFSEKLTKNFVGTVIRIDFLLLKPKGHFFKT